MQREHLITIDMIDKETQEYIRRVLSGNDVNVTCSNCHYSNYFLSNYCVKCGKLLPGKIRQTVISFDELLQLKKDANMSIMDKIKKEIKKL